MKQLLMVPDLRAPDASAELAKRWSLGFEFNNFYSPVVLDDDAARSSILQTYSAVQLPALRTMHGAFFDVIPCSIDPKIREISALRIAQSIDAARAVGAGAVVFHTNYNPQLNTPAYIDMWLRENAAFWSGVLQRNPDISIYLENMFDTSPEILAELSQELSRCPNYGVCLDYAHAAISPTPCAVWAERLGPFVRHIHLNDNDLQSDLHLAWGDGLIDRSGFYRCYEKYLHQASVLVEVSTLERAERSLAVLEADGFYCPAVQT